MGQQAVGGPRVLHISIHSLGRELVSEFSAPVGRSHLVCLLQPPLHVDPIALHKPHLRPVVFYPFRETDGTEVHFMGWHLVNRRKQLCP